MTIIGPKTVTLELLDVECATLLRALSWDIAIGAISGRDSELKVSLLIRIAKLLSGEQAPTKGAPATQPTMANDDPPQTEHSPTPAAAVPSSPGKKSTVYGKQEGAWAKLLTLFTAEVRDGENSMRVSWKEGAAWKNATVWDPELYERVKSRLRIPTLYWIKSVTKGDRTYLNVMGLEY